MHAPTSYLNHRTRWRAGCGAALATALIAGSLLLAPAEVVRADTAAADTVAAERGAAPIGTAEYPVPDGAVFVDPDAGDDTASGTESDPLQTAAAALTEVDSGGTVVLREGNYHEALGRTPGSKHGVTVQNYPGEEVWFDGSSQVSDWKRSGDTWVADGWTAEFDHSTSFTKGDRSDYWLDDDHPLAAHPDQVFVDGAALRQVAKPAEVTTGTFAVDYEANTITIGSDPTGKQVRASDLGQALYVISPDWTLRGFGVRHYGNSIPEFGALRLEAGGVTVENVQVSDNASIGISLYDDDNTIDHVTAARNGLMGLAANQTYDLSITDSVLNNNNVEHFSAEPAAAGVKITRSRGLVIDNNDISGNQAYGLWLDQSDYDFQITNNTVDGNSAPSIEAELSAHGVIANNTARDGYVGITLYDTGDVRVYNNDVTGNSYFGMNLTQDERRPGPGEHSHNKDHRRPFPDSTVPWLTQDVVIANNVFSSTGHFQLYVLDKATHIPADQMNVDVRGNLFGSRSDDSLPSLVGWGGSDLEIGTRFDSVAQLEKKDSQWVNAETSTVPAVTDARSHDDVAIGLPADIAAQIGQPAGTKRVGTFE